MRLRLTHSLLLAVVALAATATPARAGFIVSAELSSSGPGAYDYMYTLTNNGTSPVYDFSFESPISLADVLAIDAPSGWEAIARPLSTGETLFGWTAPDPADDIAPGDTLSGFYIRSRGTPGTVTWNADDEDGGIFTGQTIGPAAVPEPSSLVIASTGIGIVIVFRRRNRRAVTDEAE